MIASICILLAATFVSVQTDVPPTVETRDIPLHWDAPVQNLSEAIPPVVTLIGELNSMQALTEEAKIDAASRALTRLMGILLREHRENRFMDDSVQDLLDQAIVEILDFFNNNLIAGEDKKLHRLDNDTIATLEDNTLHRVQDTSGMMISTNELMHLIDQINEVETMEELALFMTKAAEFQDSLRSVGEALDKLGTKLNMDIDFTPLTYFSFQLG